MDTLQGQITELKIKIEGLQQLNEKISEQVKNLDSQQLKQVEHDSYSLPSFISSSTTFAHSDQKPEYQLTHKDILVDDNSSTNNANSNSDSLSPDTQIRRLTAQLTAAYNRIAALEEQLLTYRIHS